MFGSGSRGDHFFIISDICMYNFTSPTINKHSLVYTISITKIQISIRNIIITHIHIICIENFTTFKNYNVMDKYHLKSSFIILLLLSGDIASNPGPVKFPCGICNKPVRKNQRSEAYNVKTVLCGIISNV